MTEAVNNYAASGVQKLDGVGGAGSTGNIQLIFAQLQMELAKTNKESALDKIEQIREAQAESAAITAAINALRNLKSEMGDDDEISISDFGTINPNLTPEQREAQINEIKDFIAEAKDLQYKAKLGEDENNPQAALNEAASNENESTMMTIEMENYFKAHGLNYDDSGVSRRQNAGEWSEALVSLTGRLAYLQVGDLCAEYGIELPTSGDLTTERIDTIIASLQAVQEETGSDIQQEMVFVQDFMGQYNSYTQGASSAISSAAETLKAVARGG